MIRRSQQYYCKVIASLSQMMTRSATYSFSSNNNTIGEPILILLPVAIVSHQYHMPTQDQHQDLSYYDRGNRY